MDTVIVATAESPVLAGFGSLEEIAKLESVLYVKAAEAEWVTVKPDIVVVAVMVTLNVPAVAEAQVSVNEAAGTAEVAGRPEHERAAGAEVERVTVAPVSPLAFANETVELVEPGATICGLLAEIVKSGFPTVFAMLMVPAKPFRLDAVEAPLTTVPPTGTVTAAAGPVRAKSPTKTVIGARWKTVGGTAASVAFAVTT